MSEPTNRDLLERINLLESKVDHILTNLERATGAWLFIKWMGTIALGVAVISTALANWWNK